MATTTTLRPIIPTGFWPAPTASWIISGGSGSFAAATNDNSDSTYLTAAGVGSAYKLPFQMGTYTRPANSFDYQLVPRVRVRRPTGSGGTLRVEVNPLNGTRRTTGETALRRGSTFYGANVAIPTNAGALTTTTYTAAAGDLSDWLVTSWSVSLYFSGSNASALAIVEVYLDVVSHTLGAVTINAPSGTITDTTRPTIDSSVTDPEADGPGQVRYVYDAATYGAAGFDPVRDYAKAVRGWSDVLSGVSSAQQYQGYEDLSDGTTYRVYAWPKYGLGVISPVTSTFTITLAKPIAPTVTAVWDATEARSVVTVAGHANMLTAQQATMEATGTTGFTVGTNCTLARTTAQAKSGSASLQVTATAAATFNVRVTPTGTFTDYVPVVGAEDYTFIASVRTAVTARGVTLGLAWYDGAGTLLSTTTSPSTNDASGAWTTLSLVATAPAGALYVVPIVTWATAAASEVHYVDELALYPGVTASSVNLLSDVYATFESGTTYWNQAFSSSTITVSAVRAQHGTNSLLCSWGNGTGGNLCAVNIGGLTIGQTYTFSLYAYVVSGAAVTISAVFGGPTLLGTPAGTTAATSGTGSWQRLGMTFVATATNHGLGVTAGAGNLTGQSAHIDAVQLETGSAATTFGVASVAWSLGGLSSAELIIERSTDAGGTWETVRPNVGATLGSGGGTSVTLAEQRATVYDYEAPRGVALLYRAIERSTLISSGGVLPSAYSANASVTSVNDGAWWIKAPLDPTINAGGPGVLRVTKGSLSFTRDEDLGTFRPLGRSNAVVVAGDLGGEDGSLQLTTLGASEWAVVEPLLTHQEPWLLQDPDGSQKYVRINTAREWTRDAGSAARRVVRVPYVEVDAP